MMRIGYVVFCLAAMGAVWLGVRFLVTGISRDFGIGLWVGCGLTIGLLWISNRIDRSRTGP